MTRLRARVERWPEAARSWPSAHQRCDRRTRGPQGAGRRASSRQLRSPSSPMNVTPWAP